MPPPAALFLSAHLAKPSASLATVHSWSNIRTPQSEQVTEALLGADAGSLVDLDAPVDIALALGESKGGRLGADSFPRIAVSVALKDPEGAKAALAERTKLVPFLGSGLLLQAFGAPASSDPLDDDGEGAQTRRTCALLPAAGSSSLRLVCTRDDKRALEELGPWLTRSAARATATTDMHVDLRMEPLKAAVSGHMKLWTAILSGLVSGNTNLPSSRELVTSVLGDLGNFVLDLDSANLDVELSDPAARAGETLLFSGTSSTIARMATANADRNGAPPEVLWHFPADAGFAFFERGLAPGELARAWEVVLGVLSDLFTKSSMVTQDREAILRALRALPSSSPAVCAGASNVAALEQMLAEGSSDLSPAKRQQLVQRSRDAVLGWTALVLDEPATRLKTAVADLAHSIGRPSVLAALRETGLPPPTLRAAVMPKREAAAPDLGAGAGWPKDAVHYVLEVPQDASAAGAKPMESPSRVDVLIVPDAARTWVAFGESEALVARKLGVAMAGAGDTLGGRADLAGLRSESVGSGGFVTWRGLALSVLYAFAADDSPPDRQVAILKRLDRMPHAGTTPIFFSVTPAAGPSVSSVKASLQVPRGAIEDLLSYALSAGLF